MNESLGGRTAVFGIATAMLKKGERLPGETGPWERSAGASEKAGSKEEREAARLAALDYLDAVRPEADHVLQEIVDDVRGTFGTDLCMVNLVLSDDQYFRAWSGELPEDLAEARRDPRERSMCRYVVGTGAPLVVEDFLASEEFRDQHFRVNYGICFYAGTPLVTSDGHAIGSLCLLDTSPREFGERDLALLSAFARVVVGRLELLGSLGREQAAKRDVERLNRRNELILNSAGEGIFGLDLRGNVAFVNPTAARLLGWEVGELTGRHMHGTIHHSKPDGSLYPTEECPIYAVLADGMARRVDDEVFWRKDGTSVPIEYASTPVFEDGAVGGAVVVFSEIAERKRAEEALKESERRFRQLFDQSVDALLVHDESGRVVDCNAEACRSLGYSREELLSLRVKDFATDLLTDDEKRAAEGGTLWQRVMAGEPGSGVDGVHYGKHRRKDGTTFPVEVRVGTVDYGSRRMIIASVRDITERERAEEELRWSEKRFRSLIQNSSDVVVVTTEDSIIKYVSPSVRGVWGFAPEDLIGTDAFGLVHPDDVERVRAFQVESHTTPGVNPTLELRMRHADGSWRCVEGIGNNLLSDPSVGGLVVTFRDVTERKRAEEALKESEKRFRSLVQHGSDIITVLEADGTISYESPAVEKILGYRPEELVGKNAFDYVHPEDTVGMMREFIKALENPGCNPVAELRFHHKDGSWRHIEVIANNLLSDRGVKGIVVNSRDVTERKSFEEQLAHQAFHDSLTGLPNRNLFTNRLRHALARTGRRECGVALLFLDLDDFKVVNDSLGHEAGDELLVAVAERLRTCLREADTAARLGGDEFAVLLEDVEGEGDAVACAQRIAEELRTPFALGTRGEHEVFVRASVGIAFGGDDEADGPEDLLRRADVAMYEAKRKGKAQHEVFVPRMDERVLGRLRLETDLRRAVEREEFLVHYQPEVSLETGEVVGFEALVRWKHPQKGLVFPAEFIPAAEETGLIVPLGCWVIEEACHQAKAWQDEHSSAPPFMMSVNLSARQFEHPELVRGVAKALRETGLPAESLILEITESAIMEDARGSIDTLRKLESLGVKLAIDDFGTGYSSLAYLKRFQADYLKVDRSFVDGLGKDPEDEVLVAGMIGLARTLGLKVVAEGVETTGQLARLHEVGCDLAQGYLFSKPLPAREASAFLAVGDPGW